MGKEEEKIFCLVSGIEGPHGYPMLNSQFFPLEKTIMEKIVMAIAVCILCLIAIAVKLGILS